jgi:hypothetical protein
MIYHVDRTKYVSIEYGGVEAVQRTRAYCGLEPDN